MKDFITTFCKLHKFFVEQSPSFMQGVPKVEYYTRYPFAYRHFMWHSLKEWYQWNRKINNL
jgi:hypothetical protein